MNILSEAPATPNKKANDRCGVATSRLKTTALLSLCVIYQHMKVSELPVFEMPERNSFKSRDPFHTFIHNN